MLKLWTRIGYLYNSPIHTKPIEITLLKVITYGLQTYSVGMEAWIVHAYKLILGKPIIPEGEAAHIKQK